MTDPSRIVKAISDALKQIPNLKAWSEMHGLVYPYANQIKNLKRKKIGHEILHKYCEILNLDPVTGAPKGNIKDLKPHTVHVRIRKSDKTSTNFLQHQGARIMTDSVITTVDAGVIPDEADISDAEYLLILEYRMASEHPDAAVRTLLSTIAATEPDAQKKRALAAIVNGDYLAAMEIITTLLRAKQT